MSDDDVMGIRRKLFDELTYIDERDIRRWKFSRRCVDPYDFTAAGYEASERQEDQYIHDEIDAFEKEQRQ